MGHRAKFQSAPASTRIGVHVGVAHPLHLKRELEARREVLEKVRCERGKVAHDALELEVLHARAAKRVAQRPGRFCGFGSLLVRPRRLGDLQRAGRMVLLSRYAVCCLPSRWHFQCTLRTRYSKARIVAAMAWKVQASGQRTCCFAASSRAASSAARSCAAASRAAASRTVAACASRRRRASDAAARAIPHFDAAARSASIDTGPRSPPLKPAGAALELSAATSDQAVASCCATAIPTCAACAASRRARSEASHAAAPCCQRSRRSRDAPSARRKCSCKRHRHVQQHPSQAIQNGSDMVGGAACKNE
jgi:hypothetical protein